METLFIRVTLTVEFHLSRHTGDQGEYIIHQNHKFIGTENIVYKNL